MQHCKIILSLLLPFLTFSFSGINLNKEAEHIWLLLLHYKDGKSTIEDKKFFLHPEGYKEPFKELEETVKRLKSEPKLRCKFPARACFIEKYLKVKLPKPKCPELEKFLSEVKGSRISIIFADYHINSPASMFGHTFLRIFEKERNLYTYVVNYSANVDESNPILYAFKGLFGYYKGYYSVAPFYIKIKEYVGIEGRDLWEYELKVSAERLHLLKLHLWELKNVYSYYYFFQKNCSSEVFHTLNLLYPEDKFELKTWWTVPIDTVKFLVKKGYVKNIFLEPSILTKLKERKKFLSSQDIELITLWAQGKEKLPKGKSIHFYEFAADYIRFLYYGKAIDAKVYRKKFLEVLKLRSKIKYEESLKIHKIPPHKSHDSQRVSFSFGIEKERRFLELFYRPVYHDLLDNPKGYKKNAEIIFSEISFRYFPEKSKFLLNRWSIIKITSLEPVLLFYKPISWKVNFGIYRFLNASQEIKSYILLNTGGGYTFESKGISFFLLPEVRLLGVRELVLGTGIDTGILFQGKLISFLLSINPGKYFVGFSQKSYAYVSSGLDYHFKRNLSLRLKWDFQRVGKYNSGTLDISVNVYF